MAGATRDPEFIPEAWESFLEPSGLFDPGLLLGCCCSLLALVTVLLKLYLKPVPEAVLGAGLTVAAAALAAEPEGPDGAGEFRWAI